MAVELLPKELVGVPGGGKEVQAVWWVHPTDVSGSCLADEVGQRLVLVRDVLEGLRDELVEVVAVGDLLLDVEDCQLELLQQAILVLLLPLREVEEVAGVSALVGWCTCSCCAPVDVARSVVSGAATSVPGRGRTAESMGGRR